MSPYFLAFLLAFAFLAGFACSKDKAPGRQAAGETNPAGHPNVVFILTDDQDVGSMRFMPKTRTLLADRGVTFENSFVTTPLCCPSRATFLTGLYAHNHDVTTNYPPTGGEKKFRKSGVERDTIATRMQAAGYRTGYMGKYLNGYDSLRVPRGWDAWRGWMGSYDATRDDQNPDEYRINEDGVQKTYDRWQLHDTDYLAREATEFVTGSERPFFLVVAPNPPHAPAYVPKRYKEETADLTLPRPPSFDEPDASDKPRYVQETPRLTDQRTRDLETLYRQRAGSLKAVDDLVEEIVGDLEKAGELDNTYIVYTSDNGYTLGEHRQEAKMLPYEESIRVPLMVRGPGVPQGETRPQIAANVDWAPSVADWGGASSSAMDGRSLAPVLSGESHATGLGWREGLLIESFGDRSGVPPAFDALRTAGGEIYVEYETGEKELYDLSSDPYELENLLEPSGGSKPGDLPARLDALRDCRAKTCWEAEDGR